MKRTCENTECFCHDVEEVLSGSMMYEIEMSKSMWDRFMKCEWEHTKKRSWLLRMLLW